MTQDEMRKREDAIWAECEAEIDAARAAEDKARREAHEIIRAAAAERERKLAEAITKRDRRLTELCHLAHEEAER